MVNFDNPLDDTLNGWFFIIESHFDWIFGNFRSNGLHFRRIGC